MSAAAAAGPRVLGFGAFCALLAVALSAAAGFDELRAISHQLGRTDLSNPRFNALALAVPWLFGVVALAVLYLHRSVWVRAAALVATGAAIAVDVALRLGNGVGYTPNEASLFWQELGLVDDAIRFFAADAGVGVAAGLVVIAALTRVPRPWLPRPRSLAWLALPAVACAAYYHVLKVTDASVVEFPLPYRVPLLTAYAYHYQTHFHGARQEPVLEPDAAAYADHVVVVMDESIRGDLLHVNGGALPTTAYLDGLGEGFYNYGVASSIANLSGAANIVIQSGLGPSDLPDTALRSLTQPSLFDYYARAGYFTSYVNAQGVRSRPPNFLTEYDVDHIDQWVDVRSERPGVPEWQVDREILPFVRDTIATHDRSFTWVLKAGVHFPYAGKAPEAKRWDGPVGTGPAGSAAEIVRDYLGALRWSSDEFLREFLPGLWALRDRRILVLYTADHGQSLFEAYPERPEWDGLRGHGTPGSAPPAQARIPLMFFAAHPEVRAKMDASYVPALRDRASAFEIFPTLLVVAGYDAREVKDLYQAGLFDAAPDRGERRFVSGNHFGAGGPLYRPAPYRTVFSWNAFSPRDSGFGSQEDR